MRLPVVVQDQAWVVVLDPMHKHCNTLQQHCNNTAATLHHIATYSDTPCNTLQHPATPCNTLQHPATQLAGTGVEFFFGLSC